MTASDLHAEALALIAERRALLAAGTPGPWGSSVWHYVTTLRTPTSTSRFKHAGRTIGEAQHANAALIVAAVNGYGPLLDLAEHTFTMHAPDEDGYCLGRHYRYEGALLWDRCPDATAALRSLGLVVRG